MSNTRVITLKAESVYGCDETHGVPKGHDIDSENLTGYVTVEVGLWVDDYEFLSNATCTHPKIETAKGFELEVKILAVKVIGNVTYFNDSNPDSKDDSTTTMPISLDIDVEAHNKANRRNQWEIESSDVGSNTKRLNVGRLVVKQIDLTSNEVIFESL
jgi:hypothetical protein